MVVGLVFATGDLGKQFRLLHHAKSFASQRESHIYLIGTDISSLPLEVEDAPNIHRVFIHQFQVPAPMCYLIMPISALYIFFQLLLHVIRLPSLDFIITSTSGLIDPFLALLFRYIKKCKLVYDIAAFRRTGSGRDTSIYELIGKWVRRRADFRIVPTRAMQVVLKITETKSVLIRDAPGPPFVPNPRLRSSICELLGITTDAFLLSVPVGQLTPEKVKFLSSIAEFLDKVCQCTVVIVVFGNGKGERSLEKGLAEKKWKHVRFFVLEINTDVYADILGCSDMGLVLKGSIYGLDLSPELNAVLACGVPVLVCQSGCVREVVKDGENGFVLTDEGELCRVLKDIIVDKLYSLMELRERSLKGRLVWDERWHQKFCQKFTK
jgi:glycosyltransferase involved in cell wall biosynthesis